MFTHPDLVLEKWSRVNEAMFRNSGGIMKRGFQVVMLYPLSVIVCYSRVEWQVAVATFKA